MIGPSRPLLAATAGLTWLACSRATSAEPPTGAPRDAGAPADPAAWGGGARPSTAPRVILRERKCMGTLCSIKAFAADEALVDRAAAAGFDEMDRIEGLVTSWRESSEISAINRAAGRGAVKVSPETLAIVEKALWIAKESRGGFDITVGVFRGLWKFDEDNDGSLPSPAEVGRRLRLVSWRDVLVDAATSTVKLRRAGQRLNVEGLAKGYAVDAGVRAIRAAGLRDFIVQAGGDLFASGRRGDRDWRVGIQDPRAPHGQIIYELSLSDRAFNTSGDYERFILKGGVRYHHILDARTGFPARKTRSVTVLAPDSFTSDTLDTALFIMGPEAAMPLAARVPGVEVVIVDAKNRVHVSPGLKARLIKRRDPTDGP